MFRFLPVLALLAPCLAACVEQAPPSRQPAFYVSMASASSKVDPVSSRNLINGYRANLGLPPVAVDARLQQFAEMQAEALARADQISMTRSQPLPRRLQTAGIGSTDARENVSAGYHSFSDAFSGWRGSPNHDATLRLSGARRMGIATAYNPQSKYRVFWVLVMAE